MTSSGATIKINTIMGIIAGGVALLTWLTGYTSVPEMFFGKAAKKELTAENVLKDNDGNVYSADELLEKIRGIRNYQMAEDTTTVNSGGINEYSTNNKPVVIDTGICNLVGNVYNGAYAISDNLSFKEFEQGKYMVEGDIAYHDTKGVISATGVNEYTVESGNLSGKLWLKDGCKTLQGEVTVNGYNKNLTYYLEKK
jgi:hypothetical protein